jgi:hypothetical protein
VYTNNLKVWVRVFPEISSKESVMILGETGINSSFRRPGNCRHHILCCTESCAEGCSY